MQLRSWRFDDPLWITRPTSNALGAHNLVLAESWSGYALDTRGGSLLLLLPMLSGTPKPNLAASTGTVRFWFAPGWTSQSAGGMGPGDWARLFEAGFSNDAEAFWITLAADPKGDTVTLAARFGAETPVYLQTSIQWNANQWHQLAIVYSESGTLLVIDGTVAASTPNKLLWPASTQWPRVGFALGSGLDGEESALGQFEELTTFRHALTTEDLAWNYQELAPIAALGPITEQELTQRRMEREMMSMSAPPPPPGGGGGGSGGGASNPPSPAGLKLTKPIIAGSVLSTTLREADTNNAYDIFQKLALQPTNKWSRVALGNIGQTNFTLAVPSTNHAFYIAAAVVDSDFDGLPDAYEELILGTSALSADTNGDGIPDGNGDLNGNGLPDYVDYNGLTRVVAFATRSNAFEGRQEKSRCDCRAPRRRTIRRSSCTSEARQITKGIIC